MNMAVDMQLNEMDTPQSSGFILWSKMSWNIHWRIIYIFLKMLWKSLHLGHKIRAAPDLGFKIHACCYMRYHTVCLFIYLFIHELLQWNHIINTVNTQVHVMVYETALWKRAGLLANISLCACQFLARLRCGWQINSKWIKSKVVINVL